MLLNRLTITTVIKPAKTGLAGIGTPNPREAALINGCSFKVMREALPLGMLH
jgi:hypothetical protein